MWEKPETARSVPPVRRSRRRWIVAGVVLVLATGFSATFHRFLFLGNVGVVVEGKVYRSAQPRHNVGALVNDYKLGSILNLRGGSEKNDWYVAEVADSRSLGVELYDFPMSAVRRPRRRDLLTILDVLDRCRYPLLIHCKSGSDRTGLAVGLYLMAKQGEPPERAEQAFSLSFGHVAIGGPQHLHEPFDEYAAWLSRQRLKHSPERLRDWIKQEYQADDPQVDPPPIEPGPRHRGEPAE